MTGASNLKALWHFLDVAFDEAARQPLNLDIADVFMAVEDFLYSYVDL